MSFLRENAKQFTLIAVLLIVTALVYVFFIRTPAPTNGGIETTTPLGTGGETSDEILLLLLDLKSYKLNDLDLTVFADPIFQSLVNFTVPVPPETPGRTNPFAPFSGASSGSEININATFSR